MGHDGVATESQLRMQHLVTQSKTHDETGIDNRHPYNG
jgi:hypothetical protein